ncbi:unnamed protein product [Boreogadus saida]
MSEFLVSLLGERLVDSEQAEVDVQALGGRLSLVGLYFGCSQNAPCKQFNASLCEFYSKFKKTSEHKDKLEIVFISSDQDQKHWQDFLQEMQWPALPFKDRHKKTLTLPGLFLGWGGGEASCVGALRTFSPVTDDRTILLWAQGHSCEGLRRGEAQGDWSFLPLVSTRPLSGGPHGLRLEVHTDSDWRSTRPPSGGHSRAPLCALRAQNFPKEHRDVRSNRRSRVFAAAEQQHSGLEQQIIHLLPPSPRPLCGPEPARLTLSGMPAQEPAPERSVLFPVLKRCRVDGVSAPHRSVSIVLLVPLLGLRGRGLKVRTDSLSPHDALWPWAR